MNPHKNSLLFLTPRKKENCSTKKKINFRVATIKKSPDSNSVATQNELASFTNQYKKFYHRIH